MMWNTHLAFGLFVALLFPFSWLFVLLVLVGSLLPDLDSSKSKFGRKVKIIGWLFKHRGLLHSVLFGVGLFIILYFFGFGYLGLGLLVGIFSHLVADAFTKEGIRFFYPFKFKINGFIRTNGLIEKGLFVLLVVADVIMIII
jgi:inner membrane protein